MSPLKGREGGPRAGKRLSLWRVAVSVVAAAVVCTLGVAAASAAPAWIASLTTPETETRWFGAYYDVTLESGERLAANSLAGAGGTPVLSFVVAAAPDDCTPGWGVAYDLDAAATDLQLDRRVELLRRNGQEVAVSFGGAINTELALACTDTRTLRQAYGDVLERYGVDIMDIDLEGESLHDTAAAERRAHAVAQLQRERRDDGDELEVWVTLPVSADTGLTDEGTAAIDALLDGGVDLAGVNVMTMDYGTDLGGRSMGEAAIDALTATAPQVADVYAAQKVALPPSGVWSLLGATPMIGRNDIDGEIFTLDDAVMLNEFAQKRSLARLSMWSLNRDRTCGSNYANQSLVSNECSGIEQAGEFFADALSDGYEPAQRIIPSHPAVTVDDPKTSTFPVWASDLYYSAGVTVVWHGGVYVSKWWVQNSIQPDDPTLDQMSSAWMYLGPVLPTDKPYALPLLPPGTYPEWSETEIYDVGDRVLYDGTGYEARWWSQSQRPDVGLFNRDSSPWRVITE